MSFKPFFLLKLSASFALEISFCLFFNNFNSSSFSFNKLFKSSFFISFFLRKFNKKLST